MHINIMPANSTHPAVLHCRVICLDSGEYIPAVGITLAELGLDKEARSENVTEEGLYHIAYEHFQSCDPSDNTDIMEFQYSFYPLSALVNITVLTCGIVHPPSQLPCWVQSYAVIHSDYTFDYEVTTIETLTTISTCSAVAGTGGGGGGLSESTVYNPVAIFSPLLALALVITISIAVTEGVIIALCRRPADCDIAQEPKMYA